MFPKLYSSLDDHQSPHAKIHEFRPKQTPPSKPMAMERTLSTSSATKTQSKTSNSAEVDASGDSNVCKDGEFAEIMKRLRALEGREEQLMSRNAELEVLHALLLFSLFLRCLFSTIHFGVTIPKNIIFSSFLRA